MNGKISHFRMIILVGVLGMGWFYTLLHTLAKAYGLPVSRPQAKVQELVIGVTGGDIQSLDPHKTNGCEEQKIIRDLLEGPYIFDNQGNALSGAFVYAYTNDQQDWTFNLRPGLRWSNGDPLTAYDFVYSWQRLADPQTASLKTGILQDMGVKHIDEIIAGKRPPTDLGIVASGPSTLHLFLNKPLGFLTKLLTSTALMPVHPKTVKQHGDRWTLPTNWVSNGAYCLKERAIGDKIVLTRNPNYWDNKQTSINQVTYLILEEVSALAHYKRGKIDITEEMVVNQYNQLPPQLLSEAQWLISATVGGYQLNTKVKPFNDSRVRQALNLVVDREKLFHDLGINGATAAYNIVPNGIGDLKAFQPPWKAWDFDQRLQIAQQLLQDAGFDNSNPLTFSLLYNDIGDNKNTAVAISELWKTLLGAKITLEQQEWKVFSEQKQKGQYQMVRAGSSTSAYEPYGLLSDFQSQNCNNETGYANRQFDHYIQKASNGGRDFERHPWYHRAEALLAEEVPFIPISHPRYVRLVKPYVAGLNPEKQCEYFYTKNLYIRQHPKAPKAVRY
ncbi:MAG: peptide ABC transporter substrate-binding protein [Candidatus Symbiodolus clandestinus]